MRKTLYILAFAAGMVTAVDCGGVAETEHSISPAPVASFSIGIDTVPVPLNPRDPSQSGIGAFSYAGGLALTSGQTNQLHGLSDLEVTNTDHLTAVGDLGVFLDARLVLDSAGRLVGLTDARLTPLLDEDGKLLSDKADADAEGFAMLAGGDRLVSFERRHRIWLYPSAGGPPRPAPMPDTSLPPNSGLEALSADPEAGADAYVVGAETSGDTWTCRLLQPPCIKGPSVNKPEEFGLVAIKRLPRSQTAYLLRAFDEERGARIALQIFRSGTLVDVMDMAQPMTVDNFEGLAAVPGNDGAVRFYLISDDNARAEQRTILLAFDWRSK